MFLQLGCWKLIHIFWIKVKGFCKICTVCVHPLCQLLVAGRWGGGEFCLHNCCNVFSEIAWSSYSSEGAKRISYFVYCKLEVSLQAGMCNSVWKDGQFCWYFWQFCFLHAKFESTKCFSLSEKSCHENVLTGLHISWATFMNLIEHTWRNGYFPIFILCNMQIKCIIVQLVLGNRMMLLLFKS